MKLKDINAVAKCPYCGSTNIDSFIILGVNGRRITTKWCEDCGYEYDNVVCPRCGAGGMAESSHLGPSLLLQQHRGRAETTCQLLKITLVSAK